MAQTLGDGYGPSGHVIRLVARTLPIQSARILNRQDRHVPGRLAKLHVEVSVADHLSE
jgi:hypothetical protein